ncbi:hypothetical protein PTNB29_10522 [Pyrenophora teres f. teres]|nr:hypothetical protein PTNB29_10522 [Pyrenophora teres f. teres]
MPAAGTDNLKKRGRPPKYASAEEKKAANTERRRAQRRSKAAGTQAVLSQQHQVRGLGQATFFVPPSAPLAPGGPSALGGLLDFAPTRLEGLIPDDSNDIGEYLPPLSCFGSPSLDPTPTEPDDVLDLPIANGDTPISAGQSVEAGFDGIATINDETEALHADESIITDNMAIESEVDEVEEVGKLANRLTDQLIRHQGCCQHCHQRSREEQTEHHPTSYGLQQYLDEIAEAVDCPDILASKTMSTHGSDLASQMDAASRRQLYCGFDKDNVVPTPICLEADDHANVAAEVTFDIDSVLGFPNSLAVAKQGVRWNSTQMTVTDLQSGLHLKTRLAHYVDGHGHAHSVRKPLHQLPHYTFGRLVGFEDISLYIFFPYLYREEQKMLQLEMPAAGTDNLKKRGRPPKYASAEEKKAANTERRRAQRRSKAAGTQAVLSQQHQVRGLGQATFFVPPSAPLAPGGPSALGGLLDFAPTRLEGLIPDDSNDIGEYLPPLSCFGSPSLDPTPTEPDDVLDLPIANGDTPISAGQSVEAGFDGIATINDETEALHADESIITDNMAIESEVDEVEEVGKLANRLTDQLIRHQGCCQHCHQRSREEQTEHHPTSYGLQQYLDEIAEAVDCPDILASKTMSTHGSDLASQMDAASRRQLYCGFDKDNVVPTPICLEADDHANVAAEVTFDIDSVLGFPNSLAVAKQGVRWNSTQMTVTDLQSGLHLKTRLAHYVDGHGHAHSVRKPLHQLPHYTFGRLVGFEDISLYIFFPYLYREEQKMLQLEMPAAGTDNLKKRGRPPKYASAEEKKAANTERRRAQRRSKAAGTQAVLSQQHQVRGLGQATFFVPPSAPLAPGGPSALGGLLDFAPTRLEGLIPDDSNDIGEYLPPLSCFGSPSLDPTPTEPDDVLDLPIANGDTPISAGQSVEAGFDGIATINDETEALHADESIITDNMAIESEVDEVEEVGKLANRLTDQLIRHQGCCQHCHQRSREEQTEHHPTSYGLQQYLDEIAEAVDCPDILASKTMSTHGSDLASQMDAASRRQLYCGFDKDNVVPTPICLEADDHANVAAEVTFDIDSVLGFPNSLAVAKQGVRWNSTQMTVTDLQSGLHLKTRLAHYVDGHGHAHSVRKPLHQLPHYTFGRLVGFEDISLYIFFPYLYREEQKMLQLEMPAAGTDNLKKRGRPPKYASAEEKKAANTERRRAQRRSKAAGTQAVLSQQHQVRGLGQATFFVPPSAPLAPGGPSALGGLLDFAPTRLEGLIPDDSNDIGEYLPPLSCFGSPSLDPTPTEPDDVLDLPIANGDTPISAGQSVEAGFDGIATINDETEALHADESIITDNMAIESEVDEVEEVGKLANRLTDQLIRHQGCCQHCHQRSREEQTEHHPTSYGLQQYLDEIAEAVDCPDILASKTMSTHGSDLASQMDAASRRQLYCGFDKDNVVPTPICLEADDHANVAAEVTFDIDSVLGFPNSLAVAKQGVRWNSTQMTVTDLQSGLHLKTRLAHYVDGHGHAHSVRKPLHQLPHYTFGRLVGFEDISLYIFFPYLYREEQKMLQLEMPAAGTDNLKKRGRPPKYASAEEKKAANTERRRAQRRSKAAGTQAVLSQQHQVRGLGQATFFVPPSAPLAPGGPSALGGLLDFAPTRLEGLIPDDSNDIGEYLPPLSCFGSPSLDPTPTEPDDVLDLPIANGDTPISAGQSVEAGFDGIATINDETEALHADESIITDNMAIESEVDEVEEVGKLANRLTDQLIRHQGCCQHCHQRSREEQTEHHPTSYGLQQYLDEIAEAVDCPDILASKTMSTHGSDLASQMDAASRRQLYCGFDKDNVVPTPICLEADDHANVAAEVTFDIDSVLGFPNSLAVAKQGVRWNSTQMTVTDLQSGLHLKTRLAHYVDGHGHAHSVRKPLHQLPHYTFGRLVGFEDISLYIFFPYLYREEQKMLQLEMPAAGTDNLKKRGRPPKYASAEEKKAANTERRRAQRRSKAAGTQAVLSQQHQVRGLGQATFFVPPSAPLAPGGPSALGGLLDFAPTRLEGLIPDDSNDIGEYLPPLSCFGSPSLDPTPTEPDDVLDLPIANGDTPISAGQSVEAGFDGIATINDETEALHADESIITDNMAIESEVDEVEEVGKLANRLTDQLIRHQGCCQHCHQRSREEQTEHHPTSYGLQQYLDEIAEAVDCPDILASKTMSTHGSDLASQMDAASRRQLYCGFDKDNVVPTPICLEADDHANVAAEVTFDIDSVLGFPNSLAVAKQGVRWNSTQMTVTDLQSGLHLKTRLAHYVDGHGHAHSVRKPLHQLPHYTFGRLVGFEDISLYIFFPYLYREEQKVSRLTDGDFRTWMDQILLPVIYRHHDSSLVQHYPSSFDHGRYNSTARGVEGRSQRSDATPRQQLL